MTDRDMTWHHAIKTHSCSGTRSDSKCRQHEAEHRGNGFALLFSRRCIVAAKYLVRVGRGTRYIHAYIDELRERDGRSFTPEPVDIPTIACMDKREVKPVRETRLEVKIGQHRGRCRRD